MPCMYTMEQVVQKDPQLTAITKYLDVMAQKIEKQQKVTKTDIRNFGELLQKKELFDAQQLKKILEDFFLRAFSAFYQEHNSNVIDPSSEIKETNAYKFWCCVDDIAKALTNVQGMIVVQSNNITSFNALHNLGQRNKKNRCKRCCMCLKKTWWFGTALMVSAALSATVIWLLEPLTKTDVHH
jgi:hypothetical protein